MQIHLRLLSAAIGLFLFALALWLAQSGFNNILDFRLLERIPLSTVTGAVSGEVQLKGTALAISTTTSPKTNTECIYYRYLVEKEERDSDGNTSWRTVRDDQQGLDFTLLDHSGEAHIKLAASVSRMEVSTPQLHQSRSGDYRYTEWRLDPNDTVTVFGWLEDQQPPSVNFYVSGDYLPILSTFGAAAERRDIGSAALFWLWGGITAMILASLALMAVFQIHKTLVFLITISVSCMFLLLHFGYQSLEHDVTTGYRQIQTQYDRSKQALTEAQRNESAILNFLLRNRYEIQTSQFPESLYARLKGLDHPPQIELTPVQEQFAKSRAKQFTPTQVSESLILIPIMLALAALLAWFAIRLIRIKRIQENLATTKTAGVTYGLAEVVGVLKSETDASLFQGPVSNEPCTWYRHLVQEKRRSGKNSKWVTISDDTKKQPFLIEDDEGQLRVFPGQADIITKHKKTEKRGGRKYTEWRLSPGDELYLLGKARIDKTKGDSLVFGHDKDCPYIIANIPESEVMFRKAINGMALLSIGASLVFLGAIWLCGVNGSFSSIDFLQAAAISPAFLLLIIGIMMYNDLVFLQQRCERNWANIQVSLKKRSNLVPQLQAVVKEYLSHEKHLQTGLALLRERSQRTEKNEDIEKYMAAEHAAIAELSARIEQYPDLKGTLIVQDFHRRLVVLENEIALIRSGFNNSVEQYLTRIQTFPDNLLAKSLGFKAKTQLEFSEAAYKIPKVAL